MAGAADLTRWPEIWRSNSCALDGIARARALGKRADGHTAGASYEKLNAIAAAGISACHEAITPAEVVDRLRLGLWTMLRHSSLRPDMPALAQAITEMHADTRRLMLTVDGPAPGFIAGRGFIDEALRQIVAAGVPPVTAIQMATINPATYYHLDEELGGIAPGRLANLVLLPDLENFRPVRAIVGGHDAFHDGHLSVDLPALDWDALGMRPSFANAANRATKPPENLPVIEFVSNVITRAGGFHPYPAHPDDAWPEGLLLAILQDRGDRWAAFCWLRGFAPALEALATTYNTTTHLLAIGRNFPAIRRAIETVSHMGGGIATADGWQFPLPIAGMMSPRAICRHRSRPGRSGKPRARCRLPIRRRLIWAFIYLTHLMRRRYNEVVPRKPKPLPLPSRLTDSRQFLTALLAVKKDELQRIEAKIKEVQKRRGKQQT